MAIGRVKGGGKLEKGGRGFYAKYRRILRKVHQRLHSIQNERTISLPLK